MQLFTRVLLLSLTVLGVSAWPSRMENGMETRALSPAENACYLAYSNATNQVANQLSNSTNKCEEAANRTTIANSQNSDSSVNLIRSQLFTLEQNLQRCRNETDNQRLINCTVSHFDENLKLLDSSNSLSYNVQTQIANNSSNILAQRTSCVSAAIAESKVKTMQAANDYNNCLTKIPYQRDQIIKQEQTQNQPEKQPEQNLVQQTELKPVQNFNQISNQNAEQKPVQNAEQKPLQQSEAQPQVQQQLTQQIVV